MRTETAAARWNATPRLDVYAEVLGDTTSSPEGEGQEGGSSQAAAELAGGELAGTVRLGYRLEAWLLGSVGLSVDDNAALLISPGIEVVANLF